MDSAQLRDIDPRLIELFVDGKEDGLPDAGRLDELGLGSGSVVFMLHRLGWRWDACGSGMALSEDGLVATKNTNGWQLVTGGSPMTEGRHYWEVELTAADAAEVWFMVGAARPGLDHDKGHMYGNDAYFINGYSGGPSGGTASPSPTRRASSRRATASACCSTSTPAGCATTATVNDAGRATRRG